MKIATLGPEGTFSHQAALDLNHGAEIIFEKTIRDVFETVANRDAGKGVVPIENSVGGTVGFTLDALLEFDLPIEQEEVIPVVHNILAKEGTEKKDVKKIYAHQQAYAQCEKSLRKLYPNAEVINTSSNGESAKVVSEAKAKDAVAIGPKIASEVYSLKVMKGGIQDNRFNVTRFIVVSPKNETKPSGYDRTSLSVYPQIDRPGLLYELLGIFAKNKVNLTKIESRPSKGKLGDYVFYIDCEGHIEEDKVKGAITSLEKMAFVKFLGSYPRKY